MYFRGSEGKDVAIIAHLFVYYQDVAVLGLRGYKMCNSDPLHCKGKWKAHAYICIISIVTA
jgi:hypothetical protein